MSKYLITYHASSMPDDPAALEQAKAAFGQWLGQAGQAVVDPGAPTKMAGQVSSSDPAPAVDIGGYSIIEAVSLDEAKKILSTHPFVGRGGTLQINEVMAV